MMKFESSVKQVQAPQETVYAKLSDLNNLERIKDRIPADGPALTLSNHTPSPIARSPHGETIHLPKIPTFPAAQISLHAG